MILCMKFSFVRKTNLNLLSKKCESIFDEYNESRNEGLLIKKKSHSYDRGTNSMRYEINQYIDLFSL